MNTCDFPLVFLEKAMSAKLSEYAPPVAQLMQRFFLDEKVTLAIEGMMEKEKLGVVSAVCKWMKAPENVPIWEAWLPPRRFWVECELGEIVTEAGACAACPPGFHSKEPYATECVACKPGSPHCCDKARWQLHVEAGVLQNRRALLAGSGTDGLRQLRRSWRLLPGIRWPAKLPAMPCKHDEIHWRS